MTVDAQTRSRSTSEPIATMVPSDTATVVAGGIPIGRHTAALVKM